MEWGLAIGLFAAAIAAILPGMGSAKAVGLATGVMGQVIDMLVGMIFQNGPIGWILGSVLFVGAHAFSLGINALGAYVHACRLQYIEFFGKFFEEGGVAFRPLQRRTKYVSIRPETGNKDA